MYFLKDIASILKCGIKWQEWKQILYEMFNCFIHIFTNLTLDYVINNTNKLTTKIFYNFENPEHDKQWEIFVSIFEYISW